MASSYRLAGWLLAAPLLLSATACENHVEKQPVGDGGAPPNALDCTHPPLTGALDAAPFVDGTSLVGHALWYPGMQPLLLSVHDLDSGEDCVIEGPSTDALRCVSPIGASAATVAEMLSAVDRPVRVFEHVGSDGSRFPAISDTDQVRLFDEHWQQRCDARYLDCGQGTCLPPHAEDYGFFGDSVCSARLPVTSAGADEPNFAVTSDGYFAVGDRHTGDVYSGGTDCMLVSPPLTSFDYYEIGARIPAEEITTIFLSYEGSDRLQIATLESEAGPVAVGYVGVSGESVFYDTTLDSNCYPVRTPSDGVRCFVGPTVSAGDEFFDDQCTVLALENAGADVVAVAASDSAFDLVPTVLGRFTVDTDHPANEVFRLNEGACESALSNQDFYAATPADDWASYAELEERIGGEVVP